MATGREIEVLLSCPVTVLLEEREETAVRDRLRGAPLFSTLVRGGSVDAEERLPPHTVTSLVPRPPVSDAAGVARAIPTISLQNAASIRVETSEAVVSGLVRGEAILAMDGSPSDEHVSRLAPLRAVATVITVGASSEESRPSVATPTVRETATPLASSLLRLSEPSVVAVAEVAIPSPTVIRLRDAGVLGHVPVTGTIRMPGRRVLQTRVRLVSSLPGSPLLAPLRPLDRVDESVAIPCRVREEMAVRTRLLVR